MFGPQISNLQAAIERTNSADVAESEGKLEEWPCTVFAPLMLSIVMAASPFAASDQGFMAQSIELLIGA